MDVLGPLVVFMIYESTPGIPGWTFHEFILFQGTLTFIFGLSHMLFTMIPVQCIDEIRNGTFDKILTKPFKPLTYLTLSSFDLDGVGEVLVGIALVIWAMLKLNLGIGVNFLFFIMMILLALVFEFSLNVLIASMAFVAVKSWALFDLLSSLQMFGTYPVTIYGPGLQFFLSFILPIAISSFYPSQVLLKGITSVNLTYILVSVAFFLFLSLFLWNIAIKKYTSAGG
jgi:ABC-2 type transport system permease protein